MAGPALVVVAGAITSWIAFASADGVVAEDYYKQGLAINKILAKEEAARALGIDAALTVDGHRISVALRGEAPEALFVRLAHATRAGYDQRLRLERASDGTYGAAVGPLPRGHWHALIEDPRGRWQVEREFAPGRGE